MASRKSMAKLNFPTKKRRRGRRRAGVPGNVNETDRNRLLDDAKYLHQKLSALKNVGTHSNMLVTVISEKGLPRPPGPLTPTRSKSIGSSANQRLKGLLSGRSPTFDKALPTPMRTSSPPPLLSQSTHLLMPESPASQVISLNGNSEDETSSRMPTPPPKPSTPGFRQLDNSAPMTPEADEPSRAGIAIDEKTNNPEFGPQQDSPGPELGKQ